MVETIQYSSSFYILYYKKKKIWFYLKAYKPMPLLIYKVLARKFLSDSSKSDEYAKR